MESQRAVGVCTVSAPFITAKAGEPWQYCAVVALLLRASRDCS